MHQAPVVQTMDSAIHRTNHYWPNKHRQNQLSYPVDSDLSGGWRYPLFEQLGPEPQIEMNVYDPCSVLVLLL